MHKVTVPHLELNAISFYNLIFGHTDNFSAISVNKNNRIDLNNICTCLCKNINISKTFIVLNYVFIE